ncbi:hypothetical protein ABPG75_001977 [Micractinium tetrahymenae]
MSANKENQESEQAELQSVASPRISSTGAGGSEDAAGSARPPGPASRQRVPQGYDHHDWVHWGGVGQRLPHDARSVASSAAADRDDKSIFEEPGALDAHSEGEEEEEEEHEDEERHEDDEPEQEEEEEEPVEIALTQVQEADGAPLRSEVSNVESAFTAISGPASLADVVDQLADQAVAGELSPRQAAAAIRSATRQHSGGGLTGISGGGAAEEEAGGSPSAAVAEAGTDLLTMDGTEGSDSVSVSGGVAQSSIAPSEEGWHQGAGAASSAGAVGGSPGPAGGSAPVGGSGTQLMENIPLGEEAPAAAAGGQPAELQPSEEQAVAADALAALPEEAASEAALAAPPAAATQEAPHKAAAEAEEQPAAAAEEHPAAEAAPAAPSAAGPVPRTSSAGYKSQLMQQLTTAASEEDDITVYSAADVGLAGATTAAALQQGTAASVPAAPAPAAAAAAAEPQALPISNGSAGSGGFDAAAAAPTAAGAKASPRMEALFVEAGSGAAGAGGSGTMSAADTAAALAAINAAGGSAGAPAASAGEQQQQPPQQSQLPQQPPALLFPPAWYETFKGLLNMDGVDALGRPVVVLNADAVPANMKSSALIFVKAHLEPLVNQGDYVIVFTSRGQAKLPSMWIMGAWRSLPRPFRKHVQYIVLVRPSAFLRAVLAFMRPFVSKKAGRKIKQVQSVHEIASVTDGEVTVQSLGSAFAADLAADEELAAAAGDASP